MSRAVKEWIAKHDDARIPHRVKWVSPNTCSVPACNRPVDCHGYCASHARRFKRHGDPLGGTTARGAAKRFVEEVAINYCGNDCLEWPFGDNGKGYGVFHVNRLAVAAHVYVCEQAHGPKPSPLHEVAHSCGRGHLKCCNPKHLRWATRKENHADKVIHGTVTHGRKNPANKLSHEDVRSIRSLLGIIPQHEIARRFGVCQMTISHISSGRTWSWLP
jgi:hypothetical protein